MMCDPITDRNCRSAPDAVRVRPAKVSRSFGNTLVVPIDGKPLAAPPYSQPVGHRTDHNEVTFFKDGDEAFQAIHDDLLTASDPSHFIYILGWWCSLDCSLLPGVTTLAQSPNL